MTISSLTWSCSEERNWSLYIPASKPVTYAVYPIPACVYVRTIMSDSSELKIDFDIQHPQNRFSHFCQSYQMVSHFAFIMPKF